MQYSSVVVFQSDPAFAQVVASSLSRHFESVHVAPSQDDLRQTIARHRAGVVVVDIEPARLSDVENLHREFPTTSIVCTHRLADEEMWSAVLTAGADDVLPPSDISGILSSAVRHARASRGAAA
jgi:DNA-binding NarL/FixJ family response regulator